MSRIRELFVQGDRLFDHADFEGAIKIFEEALSLDEKSEEDTHAKEVILDTLNQARQYAHLVMLRQLLAKFPDSIPLQKALIRWYLDQSQSQQATELCDNLFAQLDKQGSSQQPYWLRVDVALKNAVPTHLAHDFLFLWEHVRHPRGKQRFLARMLATTDVRLLPVFIELSQHHDLSPNIQTLFKQKAESLQLLQEIFDTELADE